MEHKSIADPNIHEPKGVSTAPAGTSYVADGTGSGSWEGAKLQGQSASENGEIPVSNGAGGVTWQGVTDVVTANMKMVSTSQDVTLTAGALDNPSSFTPITQFHSEGEAFGGVSFDPTSKEFVIPTTGFYRVSGWVCFSSNASGSPTIGYDTTINGAVDVGSAIPQSKQNHSESTVTLTGFGTRILTVGQKVGIAMACTDDSTVTIYSAVFNIERIRGL